MVGVGDRLTFALDDTPTPRYGPKVQGAGIHHNPTPGPTHAKFLYGHLWVTLAWVVRHPRWGTIWADVHRAPPAYDQSSTYCGDVAVVEEYAGAVNDGDTARGVVARLGSADVALLANHGVLVLGPDVPQLLVRAIALEWRCRNAWHVETLGGGVTVRPEVGRRFSDGLAIAGFPGLWEAMVRRELRHDPAVLE